MRIEGAAVDRYLRYAGVIGIVAAAEFVVGVFIAQAYYPNYSVTQNDLSDLGAACHPGTSCVIVQPTSIIWNTVLSLMGILSFASALLIYQALRNRLFSVLFGLWGLGAFVAGVVPENVDLTTHGLSSIISFVGGAVAALTFYRLRLGTPRYFLYFPAILGAITLIGTLILLFVPFATLEASAIGHGGMERIVVYPMITWEIILGIILLRHESRMVLH